MQPQIITLESIDSTNRYARDLPVNQQQHGTSVIAYNQTSGRGRLGKKWYSTEGSGLYCSIILEPKVPLVDFSKLTLIAGLAVAESLEYLTPMTIGLKWPNDIYCKSKKLGGILAETIPTKNHEIISKVIVGIGINVSQDVESFPKEINERASSVYIQSGKYLKLDNLFTTIHRILLEKVVEFERRGFRSLLRKWQGRDILKGKRITVINNRHEVISGVATGVDENGQLKVIDDNGLVHDVLSGDVELAKKSSPSNNEELL